MEELDSNPGLVLPETRLFLPHPAAHQQKFFRLLKELDLVLLKIPEQSQQKKENPEFFFYKLYQLPRKEWGRVRPDDIVARVI